MFALQSILSFFKATNKPKMTNQKSTYAVFEDSGKDFYFNVTNIPVLKDGELLVRNSFCTICRSDLNTFIGKRKEKTPTILGHEVIGRIEGFGANSKTSDLRGHQLEIGDRITWAIYGSNPESSYSKKGMPQKAPDLFKYGHEQITSLSNLHGGLSEYTIIRKNTPVVCINADVPDPVAALINCSVATVAGAIRLAGNLDGQNVLINGTGMLGIIACAMAMEKGAKNVIARDANPARARLAQNFGANYFYQGIHILRNIQNSIDINLTERIKPDVVLEFSGVPDAMEDTLKLLDTGGVAIWIGATFPQRGLSINAEYLIRNLLTIKGLHNYNAQDFLSAVGFIEQYHTKYDFNGLIHGQFLLNEVNEAFKYGIEKNPFRVGINLINNDIL